MNVIDTLVTVFSLDDQYSGRAKKASTATREFAQAQKDVIGDGNGGSGLPGYLKLATAELDSAVPVLGEVLSVLKSMGLAVVGVGSAFAAFSGYAIKQYAEFDALSMALKVYAKQAVETSAIARGMHLTPDSLNSSTVVELERQLKRLRVVAAMPGLGFQEAIQGSVRLQAIGFDARLAERALLAFGNALASAGGGKEELDGIILGLSQIVSKGAISAEEINQITERLPQFRQILKQTFGTADSESLQRSGIGVENFILRIIDATERLPRATESAQNALENMGDTWNRIVVQFGEASAKVLLPAFNQLSSFGSFLEENGVIGKQVDKLYKALSVTSEFGKTLKEAASAAVEVSIGVRDIANQADIVNKGVRDVVNGLATIAATPLSFLGGAKDFGDFLVRGSALAVTTLSKVPAIFEAGMKILGENISHVRDFVNQIIEVINGLIGTINDGVTIGAGPLKIKVGGKADGEKIPVLGRIPAGDEQPRRKSLGERELDRAMGGITSDAERLYNEFLNRKASPGIDDKDKGFLRGSNAAIGGAVQATEANTRAIQQNTDAMVDLNKQLQGGGAFAHAATSEMAIAKATGRGSGDEIDQIGALIRSYTHRAVSGQMAVSHRRMREAGF